MTLLLMRVVHRMMFSTPQSASEVATSPPPHSPVHVLSSCLWKHIRVMMSSPPSPSSSPSHSPSSATTIVMMCLESLQRLMDRGVNRNRETSLIQVLSIDLLPKLLEMLDLRNGSTASSASATTHVDAGKGSEGEGEGSSQQDKSSRQQGSLQLMQGKDGRSAHLSDQMEVVIALIVNLISSMSMGDDDRSISEPDPPLLDSSSFDKEDQMSQSPPPAAPSPPPAAVGSSPASRKVVEILRASEVWTRVQGQRHDLSLPSGVSSSPGATSSIVDLIEANNSSWIGNPLMLGI